ncbi:MAG: stage III sporulation protein AG [Lachnospiraceae bacterium]|nr:stage III sporulation protein AG [Lachnospiraceae bacterium]MDD7178989.1 stage III sporulation protein AG [bacterium]MDY5518094.1 stage III sporulation protein AG [Lachnospiraceae bacterium]
MKWDWKKLNLKDKNTWLVLGLFGVLLLVIAMPTDTLEKQKVDLSQLQIASEETEAASQQERTDDTVEALEGRLEETLSLIDGAGKVRVMITLKDTGEKVVEKDVSRRTDADAGGTQNTDQNQSSIYEKDGSKETPYVSNELTPQVEGVLVVAQGAGNSIVKQNILQSVMALFPLEAHKITIVKMSMQEVSDHENF